MDSWTVNMYNLKDSTSLKWVPIFFFSSIVFLCSFFMMNLLLAVILESYTKCDAQFAFLQLEKLEQERK